MKQRQFDSIVEEEINTEEYSLVLFRNIKEFGRLFFERVNPTHIINIWGQPYKKYRKTRYPNYIRLGRILIKVFVPVFSCNLLNFTIIPYLFGFLISLYFINYVMLIVDGGMNCLLESKENLEEEKPFSWSNIYGMNSKRNVI